MVFLKKSWFVQRKTANYYICSYCQVWYEQPLGKIKIHEQSGGKNVNYHYGVQAGPTVSEKCPECESTLHVRILAKTEFVAEKWLFFLAIRSQDLCGQDIYMILNLWVVCWNMWKRIKIVMERRWEWRVCSHWQKRWGDTFFLFVCVCGRTSFLNLGCPLFFKRNWPYLFISPLRNWLVLFIVVLRLLMTSGTFFFSLSLSYQFVYI